MRCHVRWGDVMDVMWYDLVWSDVMRRDGMCLWCDVVGCEVMWCAVNQRTGWDCKILGLSEWTTTLLDCLWWRRAVSAANSSVSQQKCLNYVHVMLHPENTKLWDYLNGLRPPSPCDSKTLETSVPMRDATSDTKDCKSTEGPWHSKTLDVNANARRKAGLGCKGQQHYAGPLSQQHPSSLNSNIENPILTLPFQSVAQPFDANDNKIIRRANVTAKASFQRAVPPRHAKHNETTESPCHSETLETSIPLRGTILGC